MEGGPEKEKKRRDERNRVARVRSGGEEGRPRKKRTEREGESGGPPLGA